MTMTWGSLGTSQNQTEETTNLPKDNRALFPEQKGKDTEDETIVGIYYTSLDDSQPLSINNTQLYCFSVTTGQYLNRVLHQG